MINKVKTLGSLLLKLELRGKTGSGKKMLLLNASYFLPGVFLPWLLLKQNTDPSGYQFSFILFLFYSLIIAFTLISELDNLITSKTETEILAVLPIESNIILSAKMHMITRYLFLLSMPLVLPGSIYFYALIKSFPRAVMFYTAAMMLIFFTAYIILLLYSVVLKLFRAGKVGSYTLIFQGILIILLILTYQLIAYSITGRSEITFGAYFASMQTKGLIDYFPPAWFAFLTARNQYVLQYSLIFKLILPLVITILSYYSYKMYLKENYFYIRDKYLNARIIESRSTAAAGRFTPIAWISDIIYNIYLRNNTERSAFGLIRSLFKNDKTVKLTILPLVLIPAGLALFALLTNQLPAPFGKYFFELKPVFHITILFSMLVVVNTAIIGVKISNYQGVTWIYDAYPKSSLKNFKNGFRKFFIVFLILPSSALIFLLFIFKIPIDQAFVHTLYIFSVCGLYNSLSLLFSKALPFTKENTLSNSIQRMTTIFYPILFGTLFIMVQMAVYRDMITALIACGVIFTVTFWINYFGFVRKKP